MLLLDACTILGVGRIAEQGSHDELLAKDALADCRGTADLAATNGDLSMGHYDGSTPGVSLLWNWARQYSLADNYFASVMGSAPANELYMVAAADNGTPAILLPAYGPCNGTTHLAPPYTFPNVGDQLSNKKFTWKWFHEHYGDCPNYVPQENPFQFFTSTHDTGIDFTHPELAPAGTKTCPAASSSFCGRHSPAASRSF